MLKKILTVVAFIVQNGTMTKTPITCTDSTSTQCWAVVGVDNGTTCLTWTWTNQHVTLCGM